MCCKYEDNREAKASKEIKNRWENGRNILLNASDTTKMKLNKYTKYVLSHITDLNLRNKKNESKISKGVMKPQINLMFKT
jgi:hypothetical protein